MKLSFWEFLNKKKNLKILFIYLFIVFSAMFMNLTHFSLRFLFFPAFLIFSPLIIYKNFDYTSFLKPTKEGLKLFLILSLIILIFFPPLFFAYFNYLHFKFAFPKPIQIFLALKKSFLLLLLAALPEEIFFRAFLQESVFQKMSDKLFFIVSKKNFLVSLIFGLTHAIAFLDIKRASTFFPSLLFGLIVEKSNKNIFYSIMFHAVANTLNFLLFTTIIKSH